MKLPSKFRNVPTFVEGVRYASKKEARRAGQLALLERAGEISQLQSQVRFPLPVNGQPVCTYVADFQYLDKAGNRVVEDVKGFRTPEFNLKAKLMKAIHGIDVVLT